MDQLKAVKNGCCVCSGMLQNGRINQALNRSYSQSRPVDRKTMYLFVVKGIQGKNTELLGDMPLSSQFGYLAASNNQNLAAKTIAHELGHGMFYLRHTFSEKYDLPQGETDNLMDYSMGTRLFKQQWDEIFDPRRPAFAWRQDEEEGAFTWNSEAQKWFYDFVDAIKSQNSKSKPQKILPNAKEEWRGKLLYITDLSIGEKSYPRIAVVIPTNNDSINTSVSIKDKSQYDLKGFDQLIDVGGFEIVCFNERPWNCAFFGRTVFSLTGWNSFVDEPCIAINQDLIDTLFNYIVAPLSSEFEIQLLIGDEIQEADAVALISAVPEMPDIRVRILYGNRNEDYEIKLIIKYLRQCTGTGASRTPNQVTSFPSTGWHKMKPGEEWDIDFGVDQETGRNKIRGGISYIIVKSPDDVMDTLRFYIKGLNPSVSDVVNFLDETPYSDIWFFKKVMFHESGTPSNLTSLARQFNIFSQNNENLSESNWNAWSRMPNFGAPCGWGLMQLDNPAPPSQTLWDWKANIRFAYDLLQQKRNSVIANLNSARTIINQTQNPNEIIIINQRIDGGITFTHSRSEYFTHAIDNHFGSLAVEPQRSLIDACWIKTYNGLATENGTRHYYYLVRGNEDERLPAQWHISDYATWRDRDGVIRFNYYVRSIGNQNTP